MAQWYARAVCQLCLALTSLLASTTGCSDEAPPASVLEIAPIGYHEVEVGKAWTHTIKTNGDPSTLEWHLERGPKGLGLLFDVQGVRLVWTPTAFDLGANKPGEARFAGVVHDVELRARSSDGAVGQSQGQLRAIPTPLANGIDAPSHVLLNLDVRGAGRWPVRTDTTALLAAPVELGAHPSPGFELLTSSPGHYSLRFQPSEAQIRDSPLHHIDLVAKTGSGITVGHRLTVELVGRRRATRCQGNPPTVQGQLPSQVTNVDAPQPEANLAFSVLVSDQESSAGHCIVRTWHGAPAPSGTPAATSIHHGQLDVTPVTIPMPSAGTLTGVQVLCSDLDDPLLGHCHSTGSWPTRGIAWLGSGPTCVDDQNPLPNAPPLQAGDTNDLRHCPGTVDARSVLQRAGQSLVLLVDSPAGWPDTVVRVLHGGVLLCQRAGAHNRCWLAATSEDRTVTVEIEAKAASSSHLEVRAMDDDCLPSKGSKSEQPLLVTTNTELTLCPGQRVSIKSNADSKGLIVLDWVVHTGRVQVDEQTGSTLPWVHRDRGGGLSIRRWIKAHSSRLFEAENIGKGRLDMTVTPAPAMAADKLKSIALADTLPWLSSPFLAVHQATTLHLAPAQTRSLAIAHNGEHPLGLQIDIGSFVSTPSLSVIPAEELSEITSPWPTTGAAGVLSVNKVQAKVTAPDGKLGTPGLKITSSEATSTRLLITPILAAPVGCGADRYDQIDKTSKSSVTLLATARGPATVIGNLSACPSDSDHFEIAVQQDERLEVAMLSNSDHATLRVMAPGGQLCSSTVEHATSTITGPRNAHLAATRRHLTCWIEKTGTAKVVVEAKATQRYDLVTRRR